MDNAEFYTESVVRARDSFFEQNRGIGGEVYDDLFNLIIDNTPENGRILDLGAGNGFILKGLFERASEKHYRLTGLDLSRDMVQSGLSTSNGRWQMILRDNLFIFCKNIL